MQGLGGHEVAQHAAGLLGWLLAGAGWYAALKLQGTHRPSQEVDSRAEEEPLVASCAASAGASASAEGCSMQRSPGERALHHAAAAAAAVLAAAAVQAALQHAAAATPEPAAAAPAALQHAAAAAGSESEPAVAADYAGVAVPSAAAADAEAGAPARQMDMMVEALSCCAQFPWMANLRPACHWLGQEKMVQCWPLLALHCRHPSPRLALN